MRQRWEMRVSSTTRVVAAVSHRGTRTISTLQGNDRHAERECQDKDHEASNPHAADALLQLACRQCSRLLGEGGGSAQRGEDLRFDTSHAVDKRCRVAVSPLDGSEWQNTRRVRLHPGKLGKPLLACTSLVDSWLCGFLRVFHLCGGEGLLETLATYHARPEVLGTKMPKLARFAASRVVWPSVKCFVALFARFAASRVVWPSVKCFVALFVTVLLHLSLKGNGEKRDRNGKGCGGSSICEHGRQRSRCKECGGDGRVTILEATEVELDSEDGEELDGRTTVIAPAIAGPRGGKRKRKR